jgi:hypothetical protein
MALPSLAALSCKTFSMLHSSKLAEPGSGNAKNSWPDLRAYSKLPP